MPIRRRSAPSPRPPAGRPAFAAALLAALVLAGCGNKGDLYLVEPDGDGPETFVPALPGLEEPLDVPPGGPGAIVPPGPVAPVAPMSGDDADAATRRAARDGRRVSP